MTVKMDACSISNTTPMNNMLIWPKPCLICSRPCRKKLQDYQATYFNPDHGSESPQACDTALNKYGGFWGLFLP